MEDVKGFAQNVVLNTTRVFQFLLAFDGDVRRAGGALWPFHMSHIFLLTSECLSTIIVKSRDAAVQENKLEKRDELIISLKTIKPTLRKRYGRTS